MEFKENPYLRADERIGRMKSLLASIPTKKLSPGTKSRLESIHRDLENGTPGRLEHAVSVIDGALSESVLSMVDIDTESREILEKIKRILLYLVPD